MTLFSSPNMVFVLTVLHKKIKFGVRLAFITHTNETQSISKSDDFTKGYLLTTFQIITFSIPPQTRSHVSLKKALKAKQRLELLKEYVQSDEHVGNVTNACRHEAGFKYVRTEIERSRIIKWVSEFLYSTLL